MTLKKLILISISLFIFTSCGGGGGSSSYNPPAAGCTPSVTNLCITVNSERKYVVQNTSSAGVAQKSLTLNAGTYVFDQTDSTNSTHPLRISTTSNGTHNSGSAYTTGVTTSGTPGTDGKTTIVIDASTPSTLYYYCSSHSGMGGTISLIVGSQSNQVDFAETN